MEINKIKYLKVVLLYKKDNIFSFITFKWRKYKQILNSSLR